MKREFLWWHHEGNRAIRMGNWKLVSASEEESWSLYDLAEDRTESRNRVADKPAIASRLEAEWKRRWEEIQEVARRGSKP